MILADTSVWTRHWWNGDPDFSSRLDGRLVFIHPFVWGELALGPCRDRSSLLSSLHDLPMALLARDEEMFALIQSVPLFGRGIGWVDAHLLASARLQKATRVWTHDKRLNAAADDLGIAHTDAGR